MPKLSFQILGVEAAGPSVAPLLHFRLAIENADPATAIHGIILHAQIQIEAPKRAYTPAQKARLIDLFGPPERWSQTLRNRLWAHADLTLHGFTDNIEGVLPVPCTYDLNLGTTKYFHALDDGDIPLLFLFSGSVFYAGPEGRLQLERISWENEAAFRMSVHVWRRMMQEHYPNSAWLVLHRDSLDRLADYKRRRRLATWEEAVDQLIAQTEREEAACEQ